MNSKTFDIFTVTAGCFAVIFFFATALGSYAISLEIKKLRSEVENLQTDQDEINQIIFLRTRTLDGQVSDLEDSSNIYEVKIGVIEESLDPENTRWAKTKQVREAITTVINEYGYKEVPNIRGLTTLSAAVVDYSERYDVEIPLVLGIMTAESAFKIRAKSHADAYGLMQVIPRTQKEIAGDVGRKHYTMFNIRHSVQFGTWYIKKMLDIFDNNLSLAIRAYNCGPYCVESVESGRWEKGYPKETIHYLPIVLKWKAEYESMGL